MHDVVDDGREAVEHARTEREQGRHAQAEAELRGAIARLEAELRKPGAGEEVALARQLADLYGTLGGTLREEGSHLDAAAAYDTGYRYETDPRLGLQSTYNALNRLISRIFLNPAALSDSQALSRHAELPFVDLPRELEAVRERLERECSGPRAGDWWAAGDLALTSALTGDAAQIGCALAHFTSLEPPAQVRNTFRRIAAGLADLETPRRAPLAQLSASLRGD